MLEIFMGGQAKKFVAPPGQVEYTTVGTRTWTVPRGVEKISILGVSAGGGNKTGAYSTQVGYGGGGGLGYCNDLQVKMGDRVKVVTGQVGTNISSSVGGTAGNGGDTIISINDVVVLQVKGGGGGGSNVGGAGGSMLVGQVGFRGGNGGRGLGNGTWGQEGAGGAAGYAGNGGNGASYPSGTMIAATAGAGGGGAGGSAYDPSGGGVGIYGRGTNGVVATGETSSPSTRRNGSMLQPTHMCYGSGGGGDGAVSRLAGRGAARIIWGEGRAWPATNTGNV